MKKQKLIIAVLTLVLFVGAAHAELQGELGILDVSGTNPATGVAWAAGDQYRLVFVTSTNLGVPLEWDCATSLDGVNAHVQSLATAAGLSGVAWTAIASTSYLDARDNTNTNPTLADDDLGNGTGGPIYLVDGTTLVATGNADLWGGSPTAIINQDENGNTKVAWPFTGSYKDGTVADPGNPAEAQTYGAGFDNPASIVQGNGGLTTEMFWRTSTQRPGVDTGNGKSINPVYAMSEALVVFDNDPARPSVDAGDDIITWLDEPVALEPIVVNNDVTDLTFAWSAVSTDPNVVVAFDPAVDPVDPNTSNIEAPIVTITLVEGEVAAMPFTVKLTLAVNNIGSGKDDVTNTMKIDVYADSCLAAQAVAPVEFDPGDINQDCITNLIDFAEMAATWLTDHALSGPVAK